MQLSDGNYLFLHNSWSFNRTQYAVAGYQPAWVIMEGKAPFTCNVDNVAFLEAAHPTNNKDEFRVYFGGSDTVVGSAVIKISVP